MKTINEILVLVKKELLNDRDKNKPKEFIQGGLCYFADNMEYRNIITEKENELFFDYLYKHRPPNKRSWFWQPYLIRPRLSWLTRHINLTSNNSKVKK